MRIFHYALIIIMTIWMTSPGASAEESAANALFVQAIRLYADLPEDPAERLARLNDIKSAFTTIVEDYPASDVAVRIVLDEKLGTYTPSELDREIAAITLDLEQDALAEECPIRPTQPCLSAMIENSPMGRAALLAEFAMKGDYEELLAGLYAALFGDRFDIDNRLTKDHAAFLVDAGLTGFATGDHARAAAVIRAIADQSPFFDVPEGSDVSALAAALVEEGTKRLFRDDISDALRDRVQRVAAEDAARTGSVSSEYVSVILDEGMDVAEIVSRMEELLPKLDEKGFQPDVSPDRILDIILRSEDADTYLERFLEIGQIEDLGDPSRFEPDVLWRIYEVIAAAQDKSSPRRTRSLWLSAAYGNAARAKAGIAQEADRSYSIVGWDSAGKAAFILGSGGERQTLDELLRISDFGGDSENAAAEALTIRLFNLGAAIAGDAEALDALAQGSGYRELAEILEGIGPRQVVSLLFDTYYRDFDLRAEAVPQALLARARRFAFVENVTAQGLDARDIARQIPKGDAELAYAVLSSVELQTRIALAAELDAGSAEFEALYGIFDDTVLSNTVATER